MSRIGGTERRCMAELGQHISTWRRINHLTQEELARRAGISRELLSAVEKGKSAIALPRLISILKILSLHDPFVSSIDPINFEYGRAQLRNGLPERISK